MSDGFEAGQGLEGLYFTLKAGDGPVGDAAGIDEGEVTEVGVDVEGESMRGDAARDVDADGGDFAAGSTALVQRVKARSAPDAGEFWDAASRDAEADAEADEGFFHGANEIDWTHAVAAGIAEAAEVEDGIADQLAGTVVGNVAATVDLVDGNAAAGQQFVRSKDVGAIGVATEGEDGGVFEQEEGVADAAGAACFNELLLQAQSLGVIHAAEIEVLDHRCLRFYRHLHYLRCDVHFRHKVNLRSDVH